MDRNVYLRMSDLDSAHWWFVARRQILADQIAQLGLGSEPRLLEVGCGPGGNLKMLAQFGRLEAFEMDDEARKLASERSGIDVAYGRLPDKFEFPPASYDLVAAFDVVEHVEEDREAVQAMAKLLRPGGRLMITVPAYQWLWSHHDERHHHWRRYRSAQIRTLVEEAGLKVDKLSYYNTLLFPLIIAVRFLKKLTGREDVPDDRIPGPVTNSLLRKIFASERFWLRAGSFPAGVSILCLARKE